MDWRIRFDGRYNYQARYGGIDVPTTISDGGRIATFMAKLDTGAEYCLFKREHGEHLQLKVEEGAPIILDSLGGPLEAFGQRSPSRHSN